MMEAGSGGPELLQLLVREGEASLRLLLPR
jgi:hypothetical protein